MAGQGFKALQYPKRPMGFMGGAGFRSLWVLLRFPVSTYLHLLVLKHFKHTDLSPFGRGSLWKSLKIPALCWPLFHQHQSTECPCYFALLLLNLIGGRLKPPFLIYLDLHTESPSPTQNSRGPERTHVPPQGGRTCTIAPLSELLPVLFHRKGGRPCSGRRDV